MSLSSGTKLGRYEIRAKIGEDGMGEVYRAYDGAMHREVAIKFCARGEKFSSGQGSNISSPLATGCIHAAGVKLNSRGHRPRITNQRDLFSR